MICCRFLGGNEISRVEGLSSLSKLQELYVENQRLPVGDHLEFEPESLNAIAVSLHRLLCDARKLNMVASCYLLVLLTVKPNCQSNESFEFLNGNLKWLTVLCTNKMMMMMILKCILHT